MINFCQAIGLPITLKELGVKDTSYDNLLNAMDVTLAEGSFIYNLSIEVTPEIVVDAVIGADALGQAYGGN